MMSLSGFREVEHTADWELEVWAPDLPGLLEEAARGMYSLAGVQLAASPRFERQMALEASDPESLLVNFLADLLYAVETEGLAFDDIHLQVQEDTLAAELRGAPVIRVDKEIKAVTYHNLNILHTADGLEVHIVFDV